MYGVKVAAHVTNGTTIEKLVALGVHSIAHGYNILSKSDVDAVTFTGDVRRVLRSLALSRTMWVPTLAAYYTLAQESSESGGAWAFKAAGWKILRVVGTQGYTRDGADWSKALRWGTLGGDGGACDPWYGRGREVGQSVGGGVAGGQRSAVWSNSTGVRCGCDCDVW